MHRQARVVIAVSRESHFYASDSTLKTRSGCAPVSISSFTRRSSLNTSQIFPTFNHRTLRRGAGRTSPISEGHHFGADAALLVICSQPFSSTAHYNLARKRYPTFVAAHGKRCYARTWRASDFQAWPSTRIPQGMCFVCRSSTGLSRAAC